MGGHGRLGRTEEVGGEEREDRGDRMSATIVRGEEENGRHEDWPFSQDDEKLAVLFCSRAFQTTARALLVGIRAFPTSVPQFCSGTPHT